MKTTARETAAAMATLVGAIMGWGWLLSELSTKLLAPIA